MLVPVEGRLHRMEEEMRKRALMEVAVDKAFRAEATPLHQARAIRATRGYFRGRRKQGPS